MDFWHMQLMFLNPYWSRSQDFFFFPFEKIPTKSSGGSSNSDSCKWSREYLQWLSVSSQGVERKVRKNCQTPLSEHVKPEGGEYKQSEFQDFLRELGELEFLRRR